MAKTASLNNTYLGINGTLFTGNTLPKPTPNKPRRPFDAGSMFLDFNPYQAPIDPNNVMLVENKFDIDYHNDVIARQYLEEVAKARREQAQQDYNDRQFEFNHNEILERHIKQRLLEIRNSMEPQADKDKKIMDIMRDLGRQNIGAKRGLELMRNAYFELGMKPSRAVTEELNDLVLHIQEQPQDEQGQKVGTTKTAEDVDNLPDANGSLSGVGATSVGITEATDPPRRGGGRPAGSRNIVRELPGRGQETLLNYFIPEQANQIAPLNQRETEQGVASISFNSPSTPNTKSYKEALGLDRTPEPPTTPPMPQLVAGGAAAGMRETPPTTSRRKTPPKPRTLAPAAAAAAASPAPAKSKRGRPRLTQEQKDERARLRRASKNQSKSTNRRK